LKFVGQVESFEPDWAAPGDWAAMYRAVGLQVVPSHLPSEQQNWKRPALKDWKELQESLVPQATFDRWYTAQGEHARRPNMGLLTGRASGNIFVIDLDDYKDTGARAWWLSVLEEHNNGIEPETCQQITGGGGRQLFFRAREGWQAPTNKTPIGVDIRGQGGFAVLPPSQHVSGTPYAWKDGCAPWECEVAAAPDWLLHAVAELVERYGGDSGRGLERGPELSLGSGSPGLTPALSPASPGEFDAFGARVDGRDHAMRDLIWAAVVNWYLECPITPSDAESQTRAREVWAIYERKNKTRLPGDNVAGLEREGRGPTLFAEKWRRAMGKWSTDIAAASTRPLAKDEWRAATAPVVDLKAARGRFVFEKIGDLRRLPPAQWLVKDWVPEGATGILYGKWAAGKSFIGFDLALHLAYGMSDWHGAILPGVPCHVLIIAREGHQGFVNRIDAFKKHHGLVDDDDHITFMRGSVSFMRDEDFAALVDAIKADATPYQLVIVDTVARVLPGVDMNEQQTVTMFMERIGVIGSLTGASTIGVHHQNKTGGMMGSTFFEANADFVFEVSREGEEGPLATGEIHCTKMKDGEDGWKRAVSYSKIALSILPDGPSSLVVDRIGAAPVAKSQGSGWPDKDMCRRVVSAINEAWITGKPWSHSPQSPDRFAPKMMTQRFEIPNKIARDMLDKWLLNDVLSIEIRDAHSKQKGLKVVGSIE
jgi:hypothetical protein